MATPINRPSVALDSIAALTGDEVPPYSQCSDTVSVG